MEEVLDLNNLSNRQVRDLIRELKYPEQEIDTNKLKGLIAERVNEKQDIVSFELGLEYFITIN
ncbi:hypothetical protein ABVB43_07435 [Staphylococcus cohnii]|uniref:hypothetical protein n=1 Tax=Staphylococcus cohnii TaxID=29382 RepID=UPI00374F78FC